ncbi:MAG: hypothetical protein CR959_00450 [Fusobacteriales bacterium]|nr:MAG: hypothetical protein CR959_00450 [Fusobacteriales bacterium]
MAVFNGQVITNDGRNLLARALAGEGKIIFTRAAFGDKKHTEALKEVRELKSHKLDLNIMNIRNDSGTAVLTVHITNKDVSETFLTQEFGVFAKIEGDSKEILYSYTTAENPDAFPRNSHGVTYESVHEILMAFSSDIETDIYIREGVIFLTRDIADEIYTKNGYIPSGDLSTKTNLEAGKLYKADDGNWYLNIGGNRSWNQSSNPDEQMIKPSFKNLFERITNIATVEEIKNLFSNEFVEGNYMLAEDSDITNLFPGTNLSGEATFDLSQLNARERNIVNVRLLALYNDLIQQRVNFETEKLSEEIDTKLEKKATEIGDKLERLNYRVATISEIQQLF